MYVNLVDTVVIKEENLFLLSFRDARLPADDRHPLGLWYRDCRFLSGHELRLNGVPAELLQASDALGTRALHEMTNPELPLADGATLPAQALSVHIERKQAWAAGAIPYLLKCGLGLAPDGLSRRLRIVRPSLPNWLSRVEVAGLRVAGASVDLLFERTGSHVTLADARIHGDLEVVLEIAGDRRPLTDV